MAVYRHFFMKSSDGMGETPMKPQTDGARRHLAFKEGGLWSDVQNLSLLFLIFFTREYPSQVQLLLQSFL